MVFKIISSHFRRAKFHQNFIAVIWSVFSKTKIKITQTKKTFKTKMAQHKKQQWLKHVQP
jgi:hypothetical protein